MAWYTSPFNAAKGIATVAKNSSPAGLASGALYAATGGRAGTDATPGYSLTNVARTQLAPSKQTGGNTGGGGAGSTYNEYSPFGTMGEDGSYYPSGSGGSGGSSGSGGGGSSEPAYNPDDLAYIDSQLGNLNRQMGRTDTTLRNSLDAITQDYNRNLSQTNTARGRALEDFKLKGETSERGRGRALDQVSTGARSLADSLRRRIGLASGSGSSAYQITAPEAVQRQASEQRGNVLEDYSSNFLALDRDKKRAEVDFGTALSGIESNRKEREMNVYADVENQRNSLRGLQGQAAGQRAKVLGGGYAGVKAAMQPYESQIQGGESLLDGLYAKYATKYAVKPVQVANTQLRDYSVDQAAVRDQQARGQENNYAPYRNYLEDEEQPVF